jgi:hypothetical protein
MIIHIASAIGSLAQGAQEDGTFAGEGLSAIETFAYFFAAPAVLFIAISVIVYSLTGERKKSEKNSSVITTIE